MYQCFEKQAINRLRKTEIIIPFDPEIPNSYSANKFSFCSMPMFTATIKTLLRCQKELKTEFISLLSQIRDKGHPTWFKNQDL